jgi:hypothetical protein
MKSWVWNNLSELCFHPRESDFMGEIAVAFFLTMFSKILFRDLRENCELIKRRMRMVMGIEQVSYNLSCLFFAIQEGEERKE